MLTYKSYTVVGKSQTFTDLADYIKWLVTENIIMFNPGRNTYIFIHYAGPNTINSDAIKYYG